MWDVFGQRVLGADYAGVDAACFAGFGEGVVTAVEVLALFEHLGEVVGFGGELAVQAEEPLLVWGEGCNIDLVLLVRIHVVGLVGFFCLSGEGRETRGDRVTFK